MILCTSDSEQHNSLDESVENFVHSTSTWKGQKRQILYGQTPNKTCASLINIVYIFCFDF